MKVKLRKNKGITLVALIITVIVMLILAGVAISAITDVDGLFNKTQNAADRYEQATKDEADYMQSWINEIDEYLNGVSGEGALENLPDGSFDEENGVNMPDTSKLPVSTTKYVTWNYNETDNIYDEQISDNVPENWYDYDNGKWANIKTTANDLEAYWVWIPRFAYRLPESSVAKEIEIVFLKDNSNIGVLENGTEVTCYKSTDLKITTNGTGLYADATDFAKGIDSEEQPYIIHPAFIFGNIELKGLWVAKYEPSENNGKVEVKPNVQSWRNISVKESFNVCKDIQNAQNVLGTQTGIENLDSHMVKNIEFGAVAALSQSQYGIYNPESKNRENERIWNNPNTSYITGSVTKINEPSAVNVDDINCDRYNEGNGPKASTTGTVYGIYDMSGGSYERVMGVVEVSENSNTPNNLYTGYETGEWPDEKYYDLYEYYESPETFKGKIGDFTSELLPNNYRTWNGADYDHRVSMVINRTSVGVFLDTSLVTSNLVGFFTFVQNTVLSASRDSFRPVFVLF